MATGSKKPGRVPRTRAKGRTFANEAPEWGSQTTRALAALRTLVLRGDFRSNQRIAELSISERLGVSRTPIRLAMERLAQEGLLEPLPSGGFCVRTFTVVEIWDAIELRAVLEGTAARLASERLVHTQELEVLRGYAHQIAAISKSRMHSPAPDLEFFARYCELNTKFHTALMDLARSGILRRTWDQVQSIPFAAPSSTILPEAMHLILKSAVDQHQGVLDAIAKRDGAQAEMIARSHARLAFTNLDVALRSPRPEAALVKLAQPPLFDPGIPTA